MTIQVSTKVCSFGKQVVEKLETEFAKPDPSGRFIYKIQRSPMCEYMINFIHKLKHLPEKYMMNSVLENFTILQVSWELLIHIQYSYTSRYAMPSFWALFTAYPELGNFFYGVLSTLRVLLDMWFRSVRQTWTWKNYQKNVSHIWVSFRNFFLEI